MKQRKSKRQIQSSGIVRYMYGGNNGDDGNFNSVAKMGIQTKFWKRNVEFRKQNQWLKFEIHQHRFSRVNWTVGFKKFDGGTVRRFLD